MKKYIIVEATCIVLTMLFVISSVRTESLTHKTAKEITDDMNLLSFDETLQERDGNFIKETFKFDLSDFSSYSYYSSDDIMNVTEVFVGVLSGNGSDAIKQLIEDYQSDKYNLFNGYAPEQAAWLDAFVYDELSGAVVFIVAENADAVYSAFLKAIE